MARIAIVSIIAALVVIVVATIADPAILDDRNAFLASFVPNQLLNVVGVILAIFLPSAAGLYLKLSEFEEAGADGRIFYDVKSQIRTSVIVVILLFILTVVLLTIKGLGSGTGRWGACFNGLALVLLLAHVLVLFDITKAMFLVADSQRNIKGRQAREPDQPLSGG